MLIVGISAIVTDAIDHTDTAHARQWLVILEVFPLFVVVVPEAHAQVLVLEVWEVRWIFIAIEIIV